MKTAALTDRLFDATRVCRFSLVGCAATATYLALVNLLAVPVGPLSPFGAHVVGLGCSIVVSYGGHHAYTFRRSGRHGFYFRRFAAITTVLFLLSSAFALACEHYLGLGAAAISILVTVLYPGLSYLLHSLWTFEERRHERQSA